MENKPNTREEVSDFELDFYGIYNRQLSIEEEFALFNRDFDIKSNTPEDTKHDDYYYEDYKSEVYVNDRQSEAGSVSQFFADIPEYQQPTFENIVSLTAPEEDVYVESLPIRRATSSGEPSVRKIPTSIAGSKQDVLSAVSEDNDGAEVESRNISPDTLWKNGRNNVYVENTPSHIFMITVNRPSLDLAGTMRMFMSDFDTRKTWARAGKKIYRDISMDALENIKNAELEHLAGTVEWAAGSRTPHFHILISLDKVFPKLTKAEMLPLARKLAPGLETFVNVTHVARYVNGLRYITKCLKFGIRSLIDNTYANPIKISVFNRDIQLSEEDSKTRWIETARTVVVANPGVNLNDIKERIAVLSKYGAPKSNMIDEFKHPGASKKPDIASMTIDSLENLVLYCDGSGLERFSSESEDSVCATWINKAFNLCKEVGKCRLNDLCDKLLVYVSICGLTVHRLHKMRDLHSSIRNYLCTKHARGGLQHYASFLPSYSEDKFPDMSELVSSYNNDMRLMKAKILEKFRLENRTQSDIRMALARWKLSTENVDSLILWLAKVTQMCKTKVMPRDRHIYVYGPGSNGKSSFARFLCKYFLVQFHSADHQWMTSIPDRSPCHFYIFDEFDIYKHMGTKTQFRLNQFNNMMGWGTSSEQEYNEILENDSNWPSPTVKTVVEKTNPLVTYVFLSNQPFPTEREVPVADMPYYNCFKDRFDLILSLGQHEKIPRQFVVLDNAGAKVQRTRETTGVDKRRHLEDLGIKTFSVDDD